MAFTHGDLDKTILMGAHDGNPNHVLHLLKSMVSSTRMRTCRLAWLLRETGDMVDSDEPTNRRFVA
jgi:hypothetical protein